MDTIMALIILVIVCIMTKEHVKRNESANLFISVVEFMGIIATFAAIIWYIR